jgi:hypothetical protein
VLFDFWAPRKNRSFFFSIGKRRNPIKWMKGNCLVALLVKLTSLQGIRISWFGSMNPWRENIMKRWFLLEERNLRIWRRQLAKKGSHCLETSWLERILLSKKMRTNTLSVTGSIF